MEHPETIFRSEGTGPVHEVLGMRHVYKARAADTGGAFVSFEIEIPVGVGAPLHRHAIDSESFFVLEGEIAFTDESGTRLAKGGDFVHLPAGGAHGFANRGATAARALVMAVPGIEAERFFAEVDAAFGKRAPDLAALTEIASRHQLQLLP